LDAYQVPEHLILSVDNNSFPDVKLWWKASISKTNTTTALLDSRASGLYISKWYVTFMGIDVKTLDCPVNVTNANGTPNTSGLITEYVVLEIEV
jgi:hypothetical protein